MHATARRSATGSAQRGVTYLVLLLAIALVAGVLAASATVWSQVQRRERERQLLWVGEQFQRALLAYAASGDGTRPRRLEDLLEDPRSPAKRRFLRRLYEDPMTQRADWVLERDERGGIIALHSRSTGVPLKTGRFPQPFAAFEQARSYADWVFAAVTPATPPGLVPRGAASAPAARASGPQALPAAPLPPQAASAAAPAEAEAEPPAPQAEEPQETPEPPPPDPAPPAPD